MPHHMTRTLNKLIIDILLPMLLQIVETQYFQSKKKVRRLHFFIFVSKHSLFRTHLPRNPFMSTEGIYLLRNAKYPSLSLFIISGLLPLNREKVRAWCVERTTSSIDISLDLLKIRSLCTDVPLGSEGSTMNEIFKIVTARAPIYKVLYHNVDTSEKCPVCNRKTKSERPLSILHIMCRLTSSEIRSKVQEAQIQPKATH